MSLSLQKQRLAEVWKRSEGNPRSFILTTLVFWSFYMAYVPTYLPLYLVERGVPRASIGAFNSASLAMVFVGTVLSGWLARRTRRHMLIVFVTDCFTFPVAALFWMYGTEPWHFLVGMLCNGVYGFNTAAFNLLLSGGVSKDDLPKIFSFQTMSALAAGLMTPLAGLLLTGHSLTEVTFWVLGLSSVLVMAGNFTRLKVIREPAAESLDGSRRLVLLELVSIWKQEKTALLALLGMWMAVCFCVNLSVSYASIYFTDPQGLGHSSAGISLLGGLASTVTIVFTLWAAPHFNDSLLTRLIRLAFFLLALYAGLLACAPAHSLAWLLGATVLGSAGILMAFSLINSAVLSLSSAANRVHLSSACGILAALAMMPAGLVAGWLYSRWVRGPFTLAAVIYSLVWLASLRFEFHSPEINAEFGMRNAANPREKDLPNSEIRIPR